MPSSFSFFVVPSFVLLLALPSLANEDARLSVADVVQGIGSRADSVFSARIRYRMTSGFPQEKNNHEEDLSLTFFGPSWRLKSVVPASQVPRLLSKSAQKANVKPTPLQGMLEQDEVSHHGKYVRLNRTPQSDGQLSNSATIRHQKPINSSLPPPPYFAGSFWFECTKQFVQANKDMAQRKPAVEVNGRSCQVLEWNVAAADKYKAFHGTNELTDDGGSLRVCAAPDLGFALPRVEYVGRNGMVAASFDSWDFKQYRDGIFIPARCRMQYHSRTGPGFFAEFQIMEASAINESIPDSDFRVELPVGTAVSDSRPGTHSINFEIKEGGPIPKGLDDVVAVTSLRFWGWNWYTALLLGAGVGIVLLVSFTLLRRSFLRRRER